MTIIQPTLTYGCKAWTTISTTEKKLKTFVNQIWRAICEKLKKEREEIEMASVVGHISRQRIQ